MRVMIKKFLNSRVGYYVLMSVMYLFVWQINELIFPLHGFELTCILMGGTIIGEQAYIKRNKKN